MSLRLRLIVAFFLLSVVPLAAVTLYVYASNARAMREAASHEAQLMAGDLTGRMQTVTAQLSDRVEHLMDVQRRENAAAVRATTKVVAKVPVRATADAAPAAPAGTATTGDTRTADGADSVAAALGEVSMLLNNIEVRGMRGRGDGRQGGPPPPGVPPDSRGGAREQRLPAPPQPQAPSPYGVAIPLPPVPPAVPSPSPAPASSPAPSPSAAPAAPVVPDGSTPQLFPDTRRQGGGDRGAAGRFAGPPRGPSFGRGARVGAPVDAQGRAAGAATTAGAPSDGASSPTDADADPDRITFDMMPIRRDMIEQLVGSREDFQRLSPEQRQEVIGEVNQRMLGIVQGIQMGAAEVQKKVSAAQQLADVKARAAASASAQAAARGRSRAAATTQAATQEATPTRRRTALTGSRLDVKVERDGKVVREANAEVNLPNLLATVFTSTRRERGEVPFAVARDGHIYTPTEDDHQKIESIGGDVVKPDAPPGTTVLPMWIVVTTADPTGSGLKFGIARPVGESLNELRRASAQERGPRSRLHRPGTHRHRAGVVPPHAAPVETQRRRPPHSGR